VNEYATRATIYEQYSTSIDIQSVLQLKSLLSLTTTIVATTQYRTSTSTGSLSTRHSTTYTWWPATSCQLKYKNIKHSTVLKNIQLINAAYLVPLTQRVLYPELH